MNVHALRLTQRLGFDYCSDGRGRYPHLPVWRAELIRCPQFPTTLPTLDELIGTDGVSVENVAAHLLTLTREPQAAGQVFTSHAELEGSLRRLKTDHIDLYYVHRIDPAVAIEDIVEELARQKQAGKIGAIGLSEASAETLRRAPA